MYTDEQIDSLLARVKEATIKIINKYGLNEGYKTLGLVVAEESGEVAKAILQYVHDGKEKSRITEESIDTAAACVALMMLVEKGE